LIGILEDILSLLPRATSSNEFHESTMWSWTKILLLVIVAAAAFGCASTAPTVDPDSTYLSRSIEQARGGISVAASVLEKGEVEEIFGARLDLVGIQPVWLKIQNLSAHSYVLFLRSIDPDYFSPYEVARRSSVVSEHSVEELYPFIRDLEIQRFITPGAEVEGYVYTHGDEGLKAINVDLVSNRRMQSFNMLLEVPGLRTDYDDFDRSMMDQNVSPSLDEDELRSWLAALPCCTSTADGVHGDPLNLVLVGAIEDVRAALISQHWDVTAEIDSTSIRRIMTAFIFGSRYRYAPVSDLYLFGRAQDMSFQKARAVIDERNHIRLWLSPVTHKGVSVWVGHISRDAGVKFSGRFWPPTTHVIDPAVDEARFFVEQDLLYSQRVERIGLVEGVGPAPPDSPRTNAEGDPYFTDGFRAVFFIGKSLKSIEELEVLNWSLPAKLEPFRDNIFGTPKKPVAVHQ
jgi:hypothetical protein